MLDRYDQDLLLDYLEGELDADRHADIDTMLAEDPQLAGLLSEMAMDRAALRALPQAQAPADLVHDVTQTLERRMLLDGPVEDTGPIPLARGLANEPRSISWGRVVGLTGLAASVALAAAVVVITLDDPLERTANEFASSTVEEESEQADDSTAAEVADLNSTAAESLAGALEHAKPGFSPDKLPSRALAQDDKPDVFDDARLALIEPGSRANTITRAVDPTSPALELSRDANNTPVVRRATAAITAIQPRQQLVLFTESPETTRDQLVDFCIANGIAIVEAEQPLAQQEGLAFAATLEADAAQDIANSEHYALLLDESQLDTLMLSLNTEAAIKPSRAGKGSVFSNQAALLTDLPDNTTAYTHPAERLSEPLAEQLNTAPLAADAAIDEQAGQQAVELRLPLDLGSPYANSRNAYNLSAKKQQTSYNRFEQKDTHVDNANAIDPPADKVKERITDLDAAKQEKLDKSLNKLAKPTTPDPQPETNQAREREQGTEPNAINDVAPEDEQLYKSVTPQIDPTRGNWLAAHLPLADTAPLLLHWRTEQSINPTKLVPVMIKRAELTEVNALRVQQQVELAERKDQPAAESEAVDKQAAEQSDDESAEADAANPPVESAPTEPTE